MDIDEYKRKRKSKNKNNSNNNYLKMFLAKVLICALLFLFFLIGIKKIENFDTLIYEKIYNNNISFAKLNKWYNKYFGELFPVKSIDTDVAVFNDSLEYSEQKDYLDGVLLTVEDNYLVPIIRDGIVVFIGEKDEYGKTIIVEDEEGIDTWYSNVQTSNINMYDYVKKGDYLGEVLDNKLILVFQKNGKTEDYRKYI